MCVLGECCGLQALDPVVPPSAHDVKAQFPSESRFEWSARRSRELRCARFWCAMNNLKLAEVCARQGILAGLPLYVMKQQGGGE
jgi:hypothetical protein